MYVGILWELPGLDHVINVTTDITEAVVSDLHPHTNYVFQVAALNSVGSGPFSATYYTHTAEDGKWAKCEINTILAKPSLEQRYIPYGG